MALKDDLEAEVDALFKGAWSTRKGQVVPADTDLKLGNDGVELGAAVLYADLADSTDLVDTRHAQQAAEIYKTFLICAAKIIRSEGGAITSYDGDRVMAVYIGDNKCTRAVRTGLKINWAVLNIIRPLRAKMYPNTPYVTQHVVGIDTSELLVARAGVRGANDLVWVGRAANYAAKMCALPETYGTYISKTVYDLMAKDVKMSGDRNMWTDPKLKIKNEVVYGSTWTWKVP